MILFISDIHLGQHELERELEKERALVRCLRHFEEEVEALYLVGDVFDAYMEYPSLAPKSGARLLGLLAGWTDEGRTVTYLTGNHDPWHLDYFETHLGIRIVRGPLRATHHDRRILLRHGDLLAGGMTSRLAPFMRHPTVYALYTRLLPGDLALRFARWVSHANRGPVIEPAKIERLRAAATAVLEADGADLVVMGHTHQPEHLEIHGGTYCNLGSWDLEQTFALLDADGLRLRRWTGEEAMTVETKSPVHAS